MMTLSFRSSRNPSRSEIYSEHRSGYIERCRDNSKTETGGMGIRNVSGSHHQFVRPEKPGRVTVRHPSKEIPIGTPRNIYRQANRKWEDR